MPPPDTNTAAPIRVREMSETDIILIADYWLSAEDGYLIALGVDLNKLPTREALLQMLKAQLQLPDREKASLAMILEVGGVPLGHCNVNEIEFGQRAKMHLHLWAAAQRRQGLGTRMVQLSLPVFFGRLQLQEIICEPYAHNPAPNSTLRRLGFDFVKTHITTPGSLNFEQEVNRYRLSREKWAALQSNRFNGFR